MGHFTLKRPFPSAVALEGSPHPVSAIAVESTRLQAWNSAAMGARLERFPQVRTKIMREMITHMTDALTRVREMTTQRVGQRLATTLIRLARQCGRRTEKGILIAHALTRQEFADLTGTTVYTVSRTLSQWEQVGVIASGRRQLTIRSIPNLERLAREVG